MIAAKIDVEPALDLKTELGEGPVWDAVEHCLYFVDIVRHRVYRYQPIDGVSREYDLGTMVGAVALADRGDLMLALHDGFARLSLADGRVTPVAPIEEDRPDQRMNDGKCDAAGRFWAGTMALDERTGAGSLYRLDPDGKVQTMIREVTISNGIDWTNDGRRMYYVDTPTGSVDVFDFDIASGALRNRREFTRIAKGRGWPDGLTVDAEDCVWVCLWSGSAIHRYAPDGALDGVIDLPVSHPTSCAFGGSDLGDLYITTARVALNADARAAQPHAGRVLRCRPGTRGRPSHRFKG